MRGVDPEEMVAAAVEQPPAGRKSRRGRVLESDELSSVFGIDIDMGDLPSDDVPTPAGKRRSAAQTRKKTAARKKRATSPKSSRRKTKTSNGRTSE